MDASRTNWRLFVLIAGPLGAAATITAIVAFVRDPSPLARLPESVAVERDVPYGPGEYRVLDIAYPRDRSATRPAIVMIHPGGWMFGDKSFYHGLMAEYAGAGYVTVGINFRPSGVARFPAAIEDCRRAVRWVRAHAEAYGVDPGRIGVTGFSSGAHLAMLLALSDDEKGHENTGRVQAAVCVSGVYDLLMEEQGRFPNRADDPAVVRFLGGSPRERRAVARRASPVTYLSKDDPPLLVLHGEMDRRIDAEQARRFGRALEAIGRRDEVVLVPGAGHRQGAFPGGAGTRERIRRFFEEQLGN